MKPTKQTIIRTFLLALFMALVDVFSFFMLIEMQKYNLISNEMASGYAVVLIGANATVARAWWKNNSFTELAIRKDAERYEELGLQMIENDEVMGNVEREEEYARAKEEVK